MLERVTHIEGLDAHEDHDLSDDTNPGGVFAKFFLKSEELPLETARQNRIVRKNFLCIQITQELGRTIQVHRVRDQVVFDETTQKWKIVKLLPHKQSYIRRFPDEWNAFYRGAGDEVVGTPLEILFKNDPAKVDAYKYRHITVVEQLARLNDTDAENLGMGGRDDVVKARTFIEKAKQGAASVQLLSGMDDIRKENDALKLQITDLTAKLREVLEAQIKAAQEGSAGPKRLKTKKIKGDDEEIPAGIEGV